MPPDPTQYPLDSWVVNPDGTITLDELVNEPSRITRDIADLTMLRLFMDRIFTSAGGVEGGALLFERPDTLENDIFAQREPKEVAPGGVFPSQAFVRGVPMVARPRKIGNKWPMTKEAIKRNRTGILTKHMRQTANTIRRRIENMGLSELAAVVAAEARFITATGTWAAAAAVTQANRTGLTEPLDIVGQAVELNDIDERGVEYNSIILHPTQMRYLRAYYGSTRNVDDALGDHGITNRFVTPRHAAGTATVFAEGQVGEWRNEFPLEEETEWEGPASSTGAQRWWYQWSISPMFVVVDQFQLLEIRGL